MRSAGYPDRDETQVGLSFGYFLACPLGYFGHSKKSNSQPSDENKKSSAPARLGNPAQALHWGSFLTPTYGLDKRHSAQCPSVIAPYGLERGIYAIGFFFPVVPKGKARIRTQISAAHTKKDLDKAIAAFAETFAELSD